jgi:hypothetical protein
MLKTCEEHDGIFVYDDKSSFQYPRKCPVCILLDDKGSQIESLEERVQILEDEKMGIEEELEVYTNNDK